MAGPGPVKKPNIPAAGPSSSPLELASTSKVPIMGPVQEKETSASGGRHKEDTAQAFAVIGLIVYFIDQSTWQGDLECPEKGDGEHHQKDKEKEIEDPAAAEGVQPWGSEDQRDQQARGHVDHDNGKPVDQCLSYPLLPAPGSAWWNSWSSAAPSERCRA